MLYGAHVSASGGIDKAIDRAEQMGCDAVQVFTQSPRMWRPTAHADDAVARFRERRAEAGIGAVVCHAVYLVNLATPDDAMYEKSRAAMRATVETACALDAEGVVFHVGSHLGAGIDEGVARAVPALRGLLELCAGRHVAPAREHGRRRRHDGTFGRRAGGLVRRLDGHPRLVSASTPATGGPRASTSPTRRLSTTRSAELDGPIGLDRLRCLHINDSQTPLGSNRDRHAAVGDGLLGAGLATFLGRPAFQSLPAIVETGRSGGAPNADDMDRLRALHRNGLRRARRAGLR